MKGEIKIEFKKVNYRKGKQELLACIKREISTTSSKENDFDIILDDTESTVTFKNAEIIYFSDMYAICVYVAATGQKVDRKYQHKYKKYTININLDAFTIKSINGIKLQKALVNLRSSDIVLD